MSCDEMMTPLAKSIASFEACKRRLLEVYGWSSFAGPIDERRRLEHLMNIEIVRSTLPLIRMELETAIELLKLKPETTGGTAA